jgi:hypothetical protein
MPSDKPRITLRIEPEDMEYLERWAKDEFLTVPQIARIIVKRAIATRRQNDETPSFGITSANSSGKKGGSE